MLITPPLFTPRGYCSIFTFLCFINHKHSNFSTAAFRCHYVQFPVVAGLYRRGHPPTDAQSIHLPLSILAIIYHNHTSVAHPVVAEEVGNGVLEVPCSEGSRHPPTAPLITVLNISFADYHICDTTRINPRPNTWCHIVVVIHFFKLEITDTPLTLL